MKVVDISTVSFSDKLLCKITIPVVISKYILEISHFKILAHAERIIVDEMCLQSNYNISLTASEGIIGFDYLFQVKELSFRKNNIVHLDIRILCENPLLKSLTLAGNNMEYMSPDMLACVYTLEHLDLSNNLLGLMSVRNATKFGGLLKPLYNIVSFSLANNKLTYLPLHFFINNTRLELIDLHQNELSQIEFVFKPPHSFSLLIMSKNIIEFLDSNSSIYLNDMLRNNSATIDLDGNPLSCKR